MNPDWDGVMKSRAREPGPLRQSLMAPSQWDAVQNLRAERDALAARVRELEAALRPFAAMYREGDGVERIADTCPVTFYYDMYGTQSLTTGDLRRARAAFGDSVVRVERHAGVSHYTEERPT